MKQSERSGFTLIELLVALAILGIIVVICGRIFEQSNVSWNTGSRKAEINMVGRGVADFIAQDIGRSVARTPAEFVAAGSLVFKVIDENAVAEGASGSPVQTVTYDFGAMTRNGVLLAPKDMVKSVTITPQTVPPTQLPGYVDVNVEVQDQDGVYTVNFKSRAWLANRDRYAYDE